MSMKGLVASWPPFLVAVCSRFLHTGPTIQVYMTYIFGLAKRNAQEMVQNTCAAEAPD